MSNKNILGLALTGQAIALTKNNIKITKKPSTKKIIKAGVNNIVGVSLMKPQADIIETL